MFGRQRIIGPVVAVLLACVLTACGSGASGGTGSDGFHSSVAGKFGTTTITKNPVRVVAMSWTDADIALSLGITPVGIAKADDTPAGLQPWTESALRGAKPALFSVRGSDPIEKVAELAPDVILATKDYNLTSSYPQLSQVAPVVTYVSGVNSDSWQQNLDTAATALGKVDQGRKVAADTEARIAQQKTEHPELTGKTFSYVVASAPTEIWTVNSDDDVSVKILDAFGMRLSPPLLTLPTGGLAGRSQISMENLGVLDADVVLSAGRQATLDDLSRNPVFSRLTAVQRGSYVPLDFSTSVSMAFPSPLSLDWAMTNVVPKLAAAAKAAPSS
ncbi:iron-siderophore ABC transporter substrate-binding protein [Pseudonocardia spinosispora]|uniref:iron-siderophore ABC transporter substrate-binding protein n=1 Tax=Pseudonocardia spinosispora TaxID=103441 RepID=UPI000400F6CE|nr:iron-siderophore ABC transporter substrate-binding protein [Pseudonocardia spinosispora]